MSFPVESAARRRCAVLLLLIALGVAAAHVIIIAKAHLQHPDEALATALLEHLRASATLDTNWQDAGVPASFKTDQYNFSGYFMALFAGSRMLDAIPPRLRTMERLRALRDFSAGCAAASVLVAGAIGAVLSGPPVAIVAALLVAFSPSLAMDGLYARPDAFYVLVSMLLLLVYIRRSRWPRAWVPLAAALVGFLISIKVSSLAYALLLLPGAISITPARTLRFSLPGLGLAVAFVGLGFAIGAPGALTHPREFLAGIRVLSNQYANEFGPHGLGRDSTLAERIRYSATWLFQTWGLALPFAALGIAALAKARRWDAMFAFLPYAVTMGYFMSTPVFFERNISPGIAAFAILASIGVRTTASWAAESLPGRRGVGSLVVVACTVLMLAVPAWVDAKIVRAALTPYDMREEVLAVGREFHRDTQVVGWQRPSWSTLPVKDTPCDPPIVLVIHAGDRKALRWIDEAKSMGWVEIRRRDSAFAGFVPSTFHTYLSASMLWLMKPEAAKEGPTGNCGWARFDWG